MQARLLPGHLIRFLTVAASLLAFGLCSFASAAEPYLEFVRGLRERQFYDLAETYLDQIEQNDRTPADVREVIPYERAVTLLDSSRSIRNADARSRQLDEAQALFEQFAKTSPDHPLRAQANTESARILLNKAQLAMWQSNAGSPEQARTLIAQARSVFQQAHDRYQAAWEKLKGFIPEEEKDKQAERAEAERLFMQAQLDLARCTYEEAQTHDEDSAKQTELLNQAAVEFETIHQKYRSQIAGLHARMWQGKCFEEQGDIRKALGVYNEILEHPGDQLQNLQDQVRWFRLICLNDESRNDHQLVVEEATNWRNESPDRVRTMVGLGIQYELAKAQEAIAQSDRSMPEALKTNTLNEALDNARAVARYPGPLKAPAAALVQKLMAVLNKDEGEPRDFETAFSNANQRLEETKQLNANIAEAQSAGDATKVQELQLTLRATASEMARLYDLSLKLADSQTDPEQTNIARFRLAYSYFLEGKYLEAGVVADYVGRKYQSSSPEVALESAYIALAAFDRMFSEAPADNREFEMQQLMNSAQFIAETWPESDRAIDARLAVARIFRQSDEPIQAAEWYDQIPPTSKQYADAQLSAGQSYWNAYLTRAALPESERTPVEHLAEWKAKAEQHLTVGIERRQQQIAEDAATPDDLALGKLSLVQIRNSQGIYNTTDEKQGAIELLTVSPHAVIDAVAVPEGQPRPTKAGAVQSQPIASLAYQQLLRAYIGIRDLEGARQTREQLEAIASSGGDLGALTQVYVAFGQELHSELEQLQAAGDTARLNEVRAGFESFLGDLFDRKEGQTFNSLLWIAETYTGLAEGSVNDRDKATTYFNRSADTYDEILKRAAAEPSFVETGGQLIGVQLRLVNCRREQGNYPAADEVMQQVLAERSNAIDAQMDAARLYEHWATSGSANAEEKLQIAINGQGEAGPMWGWSQIALRLQRAIEMGQSTAEYSQKHIDARYHLALCQLELADEQTSNEAMIKHLDEARFGIQRFVAITNDIPEADWKRFDELYQKTLAESGETVVPLVRRNTIVESGQPVDGSPAVVSTAPASTPNSAAQTVPTESGGFSNMLLIVVLLALGIGTAVGIYVMTVQQDKKRRAKYASVISAAPSKSTSSSRTTSRTRKRR
ncbi:MAG: hypothetical protein KDA86_05115 [Planctomycetaceae bacterium]|nr:hypothetical protein [Planctomycetaceae bacterium]